MSKIPTPAGPPILEELGLTRKTGTIELADGQYFLVTGKTRKLIPETLAQGTNLAKMVGREVVAGISGRTIVIIVIKDPPWKHWCFLCYLPDPRLRRQIHPELWRDLVAKFGALDILNKKQVATLDKRITEQGILVH